MSDGLKLSIWFGESDRAGGDLLSDVLMDRIAAAGVLASALMRGIEGFGPTQALRTDRLLTLSEDLPLVAVAVDRPQRVRRLAHGLVPLLPGGLATLERVALPGPGDPVGDGGREGDEARVTLWCGRGERAGGRTAADRALALLRDAGMPGATALAGLDGTIGGGRRRARMLSRNRGVPAQVVAVGPSARAAAVVPALRALAGDHVVSVERVTVVRRDGRVLAEPPAPPSHDAAGLGLWQRVTVWCGEQARFEGGPLHATLVRRLREAGAAGATVLRGTAGFSGDGPEHRDRLTTLRRRTPVVLTTIDTAPSIARLWPLIARATASEGLVTSELVPAYHAVAPGGRSVGGLRMAGPWEAGPPR